MRWPELERILRRSPLGYEVVSQKGSHRKLESTAGYPPIGPLAFHDNAEIPGGMVRKILMRDVGLTEEEARGLL